MFESPVFLLSLLPILSPAKTDCHPFPDIYFHYHLDFSRNVLVLSHETRWTDLVALEVCEEMDKNRDGKTSEAEARNFIDSWVGNLRKVFKVKLQGKEYPLPEPCSMDETLLDFAGMGNRSLETAEWEIDVDFEIPLPGGEGPFEIVIEDLSYHEPGAPDPYWLTSEIGIEGEEGLRLLFVTKPEDPKYMTRRFKVRWDWKGKGMTRYEAGRVEDINARDRSRMTGLINRVSANPWFLPVALLLALFYGMGHAFAPGHGKVMVAGYLVGSKGTVKDAVTLGLIVALTHTFIVIILSILWLLFEKRLNTKLASSWLGIGSGLSISLLGAWLFLRRLPGKKKESFHHHDHHSHTHAAKHGSVSHFFAHLLGKHHHHLPNHPDEVTLGQLVGLGVSGGIVPCPAALLVLLFALQTGKALLGLVIILSFSLGLAGVLVLLGVITVTSKNFLGRISGLAERYSPLIKWLPPASALFVTFIGLYFAWQSYARGAFY